MNKVFIFCALVFALIACQSISVGNNSKVSEEKLRNYIGEEVSVLFEEFKVESCNLKIAYFKDVYAIKIVLKGNKEIVIVFEKKVFLTKAEIENQCDETKIKKGKILKIKFFKDGEEEISVE